MEVTIEAVRDEASADHARAMAWEFIDLLKGRHPDYEEVIDAYFRQVGFRPKIDRLLQTFGPPRGECLMARADGLPAGFLMMMPLSGDDCQISRLYVRDFARGRGIGRALTERMIERARLVGYRRMFVAGISREQEVTALYNALGFTIDEAPPAQLVQGAADSYALRYDL